MTNVRAMSAMAVAVMSVVAQTAFSKVVPAPRPAPPVPVFRPASLRADEKPVAVTNCSETVEENALYRRVRTTITFTNPNPRDFSGDLEFPVPDGAAVCGYALEIGGEMVPGVVVGKEKARVAFESEKAKRVDPGIVEHVKGNVWRTRIFPLRKDVPRRASVDYVEPLEKPAAKAVCERDGDDLFLGELVDGNAPSSVVESVAAFSAGVIAWDASSSAADRAAGWRKTLEALPDTGKWTLVVFRNVAEKTAFTGKSALLAAVDALVYDGGTDIASAVAAFGGEPTLLFTDETDTLGLSAPRYDDMPSVTVASRGDSMKRRVKVRRLAKGETPPPGVEPKAGTLLATAWAADRIADLSAQADSRASEFLELGRRYGVASPVTSLIVLESLEQYLEHKIEPPKCMSFHDEWVRRRSADDDAIAVKKAKAEHERDLLSLWEERVKWWNNPIPPKPAPKSGLFDGVRELLSPARRSVNASMRSESGASEGMVAREEAVVAAAAPEPVVSRRMRGGAGLRNESAQRKVPAAAPAPGTAGSGGATVVVAKWDPKSPYLDAIAKADDAYAQYLVQKKAYGQAPAFYIDCADWFFKKGEKALGWRILSNMAEFSLEDAAVWRSMGWRLREAGLFDEAVLCFRHALRLRGEEGQSRRDLALVLSERGKDAKCASDLEEAMSLLKAAAFENWARRSGRRSNDRQVSIVALEELNALIAWCEASGVKVSVPELDAAFRRDLPVKVRIVLSWNADETDIDLHVLEPEGEEAFYRNRRTSAGGFVGEDVTTGYGPEEYLRKEGRGVFRVLTNYFASHQTALTGAATVTATVYTDWATAAEKRAVLTLRLDKPKDKHTVGEIRID